MGQVLHRGATTTEAIRRAIQHSQESLRALARRHGINPKTVAKWRKRCSTADLKTGPTVPKSTVLSVDQEAIIVAFRKHTLLPLDDCLYALQATIPQLTRSSLHRCLERRDVSRFARGGRGQTEKKEVQAIPSDTSTWIWPRCAPPRESSISSSPSTALPSSPSSNFDVCFGFFLEICCHPP